MIMKEIYLRPTTTVRPVYMESSCMLQASLDTTISEGTSPDVEGGPVTDDVDHLHYDAWGDVKAQHSWGDDPF